MGGGDQIVVIGAGPAGLCAALELARHGLAAVVLDRNDRVGGLARTIWYRGYGFDVGPHRFYTKSREIARLWKEILGDDLREVPRLTRIYYNGRFFHYPLKPLDVIFGLGPVTTLRAILSHAVERARPHRDEPANFEEWAVRQFGRVLYTIFFKAYTEKVWGIPCREIGREWAGQRIRAFNLTDVILNAFGLKRRGARVVKSLVDRFYYPRLGAGQMHEAVAKRIRAAGGEILLNTPVTGLETAGDRIAAVRCGVGGERRIPAAHVFASAPITALARALVPPPPPAIAAAAAALRYRTHITVNLIAKGDRLFPDNWIYIHSPAVKIVRVANYNNFSRDMVAKPGTSALSVEYFCAEGDELWRVDDAGLVALAADEMERVGLLPRSWVLDGFVVREPDSYPMFYLGHQAQFRALYDHLVRYRNLTLMGRAALYRYHSQDHAMLTGLYAARNFLGLSAVDLFSVDSDPNYFEEVAGPSDPA
ncbi:MAG: FAD-dependent oxidoreductase [Armatimonadetes bacterium]|nr:FAD-dependent oxidoreductase [Armatimonadota bacterium]